ncbi:glycoside hydrolase family 130 protein [Nakamurella deserti]|uniref:glycoside hydrolase family 130 protein n=1 Tax=Nakamurella deserti TaxID=2164074 RepID=UPI000DBE8A52|nr:glycoside hydrolase family 130 protein [Nakamurella deserti]
MSDQRRLLTRGSVVLRPDPTRVIAKLFLPGQELVASGVSRADAVIARALAIPEDEVDALLADIVDRFGGRHHDLPAVFDEHCAMISHHLPDGAEPSEGRRRLIGAYCTQEFAVEAAALFNPSMVRHPDQSGLPDGALRYAMSVRAVGEGHVSSIEFRTGVITAEGVTVDDPGRRMVTGRAAPAEMNRDRLRDALSLDHDDADAADPVLRLLRTSFSATRIEDAVADARHQGFTGAANDAVVERIRRIARGHYRLEFPAGPPLSERVIYPTGESERQGMEDARFTLFTADDGTRSYVGTYTAFDGREISPRLIRTDDFSCFEISPLIGPAATNKGMALFPRTVGGRHLALSRWDRESITLATSPDGHRWDIGPIVQRPTQPWELIQLGNCGPPIETPAGWLVLTHGVGAVRTYGIGALLLDLDDPTTLIGALPEPLLTADADERDGYVPNVVYSCGALVHGDRLVLPYGCSDSSIRIATVDLPALLDRLTA